MKDAKADEVNLRNRTTTRAIIARRNGLDYEDIVREIIEEDEMLSKHQANLNKTKQKKGGEQIEEQKLVGNK